MRALTLLLCGLILVGCGDEEGSAAYIAATIDGAPWRGAAVEGIVVYTVEDPEGSGSIFSSAHRPFGAGEQILSVNLPNPPALGVYALDGSEASAAYVSCPDDVLADCIGWQPVAGHPGTLEITAIDPESGRIAGTFSFAGYPLGDSTGTPKYFTSGAFDIRAPSVFILE